LLAVELAVQNNEKKKHILVGKREKKKEGLVSLRLQAGKRAAYRGTAEGEGRRGGERRVLIFLVFKVV